MKNRTRNMISSLLMTILLLASVTRAQTPAAKGQANQPAPQASNSTVTGSGSSGRLPKWAGVSGSSTYVIGDSIIFEDKFGKVGVGTDTPTSKLTVQGMIETTLGGVKFPDGTVQTTAFNPNQVVRSLNGLQGDLFLAAGTNITVTPSGGNTLTIAAPNALTAVAHNATLTGNGTAASPLGIANGGVGTTQLANNSVTGAKLAPGAVSTTELAANAVTAAKIAPGNVVKSLNGLNDDVTIEAGANIALTTVGNKLTIASTTADPDQSAFQGELNLIVPNEVDDFTRTGTIQVPAGKRFVIEYLSVRVFGGGECQPMSIRTTVTGVTIKHWFQLPEDNNGYAKSFDKPVRLYADGDVTFGIVNRSGDLKNIEITVSGHLVDLP